jgi:hypothetical protein
MPRKTERVGVTDFAAQGSQRWLQIAVEKHPDVLLDALRWPLGMTDGDTIEWRSPLRATSFKEYRDGEALRLVCREPLKRPLKEFWPARGPVWDAIGIASNMQPIFVEAKAHIAEMASPGTKASPASLELIKKSLQEARRFYAPRATAGWAGTFYQYGNRLAYQYFLRRLNGIKSHLVFVYFLNAKDMKGPVSKEEWLGAIKLLHATLGLSAMDAEGVHEVFVDVRKLV